MIFRSKCKKLPEILPELVINENEPGKTFDPALCHPIERLHNLHPTKDCRSYKYLGILLDEHLSLNDHVDHISKKLTKSLYCIKMAKNNLNYTGLRALYFALIHSHLTYCPSILSCISISSKNKIFKIQKKAIRILTSSKFNEHTAPLFLENKILPFEKIVKMGKLKFMHSIYYNYAPSSFANTWTKNNQRNKLNLRNENLFNLPFPRTEQFKKLTLYSLPSEWNNSGTLMFYENKFTFLHALREQLFEEIATENNI